MVSGASIVVVGVGGLMCGIFIVLGFIMFGIPNMMRRKATWN